MGAWGYLPFENDDALDFVRDLGDAGDFGLVVEALDAIPDDLAEYVEIPEAGRAIAAAEVTAAILGHETSSFPPQLWQFVGSQKPNPNIAKRAIRAVCRVFGRSEWADELKDSEDGAQWRISIEDLLRRLGHK